MAHPMATTRILPDHEAIDALPPEAISGALLSPSDGDPVQSDARSLALLAMVCNHFMRTGRSAPVLCELRDARNMALALETGPNEALVSGQVVAGGEFTFAQLYAYTQVRDETCLGVRTETVNINPAFDDRFALRAEDSLVVLAEDEG
jgi:hypothetical protein